MRPRSKYPPQTPAQRQAKCRAIKRGEWHTIEPVENTCPPGLAPPPGRPMLPPAGANPTAALPAQKKAPALPPPATGPVTAIQKAFSLDATALALADADGSSDGLRLSLPPAAAARLRSLLDRHAGGGGAGKTLTAPERAEAQGLLDIAEFFVLQRLRNRLAA